MAQMKYLILVLFLQIISLKWTAEAGRNNATKTYKFIYKKKANVRPLNATSSKFHQSLENPESSVEVNSSAELDQMMSSEDFDDSIGNPVRRLPIRWHETGKRT